MVGEKCVYPSRNAIELNLPNLPNNDYNMNDNNDVYSSSHERFRDLGIPIFVLQLSNKTPQINNIHEYEQEVENETTVISDEMFEKLFNMVVDTQYKDTPHKKYSSKHSTKNMKKNKKSTTKCNKKRNKKRNKK